MKQDDKHKRKKPLGLKSPMPSMQTKKSQSKKSCNKDDEALKKSLSSTNLIKTTSSGLSSGTQTSKYPQTTNKTTPKASLAQIREIKVSYFQKNSLNSKSKDEKQQSGLKSTHLTNGLAKTSQKHNFVKIKQQIKKSLANVIKSYYPQKKNCLDISMTEATKDASQKEQKNLNFSDFSFMQVIGEGGYGKVWRVEHLKTRQQYAMKEMSKAVIIVKKSVENILNQRKILQKISHSFIANMHFAFHDRDNLYLVMDLLAGGDLRYHIGIIQKFTEEQTKFLVGCIVVAVEYIHKMKIFHRDIKPENLVFDEFGYLKLTDFGIARIDNLNQTLDASGTPGYMAPEVLCKQVHSYPVDFYAVGIITYELIMGKRPYTGNSRNQIKDEILAKQHALKKTQIPVGYKAQAIDFVNKLIMRQPLARLGSKQGTKQLKTHPWFKDFNWNALTERKIKSPFKGKFAIDLDQKIAEDQLLMQHKLLQRIQEKMDPFAKYYFWNWQKE